MNYKLKQQLVLRGYRNQTKIDFAAAKDHFEAACERFLGSHGVYKIILMGLTGLVTELCDRLRMHIRPIVHLQSLSCSSKYLHESQLLTIIFSSRKIR